MNHRPLRIFLVEDEVILLMMLEDIVTDLGHTVAGTALHTDEALAMAHTIDADFALLDVNLNGERSFPVADALRARGIPLVFVTGYGARGMERDYAQARTLQKPLELDLLAAAIEDMTQPVRTDRAPSSGLGTELAR
jgi:CheY-like chemotaxis protein